MAIDYQSLLDMLNPKKEEELFTPMTPTAEQLTSPVNPTQEQLVELTQPEPMAEMPAQPVVKAAPAAPKQDQPKAPAQDDLPKPPTGDTPLSKSEALIAEYNRMLGRDQEALAEARKTDRMLKVGGALGDALATYLNAKSQMNVKAPGVQVQQGAGLDKVAEMFATSPEIASDIAQRREALMKQYGELAKGERAQAILTSEEKRADVADKRARELAQIQIEGRLKEAGIKGSKSSESLDLRKQQYAQLGDAQVEKLSTLKSGIDQASMLLPQLEKARKSLGIIGTPLAEVEAKFGKNPEFQKLQQDYASLRNTIRKDIFGATLTPGEATEFDNELAKIGISEKQLGTAIQGLIDRTKLKARSRLNTIAETQPLKAETARNAIKTFGLEDAKLSQNNIPLPEGNKEIEFKGNIEYKWNPSTGKYNPTGRKK